ncbi:hypothetical protein AMTRI_Chr02g214100 [Amborella trichopoda]
MVNVRGSVTTWNISLRVRRVDDTIGDQCVSFLKLMRGFFCYPFRLENVICELSPNGIFSPKHTTNKAWSLPTPHRTNAFVWLATRNRALTID